MHSAAPAAMLFTASSVLRFDSGVVVIGAIGAASVEPHSPQNLNCSLFSCPHRLHLVIEAGGAASGA